MKKATLNAIRAKAKAKAEALAKEAQTKLINKYKEGLQDFYNEYSPTQYIRTYNFRDNSWFPYFKQTGAKCYGGIVINDKKMKPYDEDNVLFGVLYNPAHTWHGSLNHPASFIFYDLMHDYYKELVKDYQVRCAIK